MRRQARALWGAFLCALAISAGAAEDTNIVKAAQTDADASWESVFVESNQVPFHINLYMMDGLYYEVMETSEYEGAFYTSIFSEKRRVTGRLGARVHIDAALYNERGDLKDVDDDLAVRRFRINTFGRGFFFTPFTYGLEFGLSNGKFFFDTGYIWMHDVPYVSSVRAGIFTAPVSMQALEGSSMTSLMEDAAPVSAFTPGDLLGVEVGGPIRGRRATLHAGWFADVTESENRPAAQSYSRLIARGTWLPVDNVDETGHGTLVHAGASASFIHLTNEGMQYRTRPESYLAPFIVDTGRIKGDHATFGGVEAALQKNNWLFQAEGFLTTVDDETNRVHQFGGAYVMSSWMITGERRVYNRNNGYFSLLRPKTKFSFRDKTWGAWEWANRISYSDLSDHDIQGGEMTMFHTGFNIYLTHRNRVMFGGGYADVRESPNSGDLLFVQARFQIDL